MKPNAHLWIALMVLSVAALPALGHDNPGGHGRSGAPYQLQEVHISPDNGDGLSSLHVIVKINELREGDSVDASNWWVVFANGQPVAQLKINTGTANDCTHAGDHQTWTCHILTSMPAVAPESSVTIDVRRDYGGAHSPQYSAIEYLSTNRQGGFYWGNLPPLHDWHVSDTDSDRVRVSWDTGGHPYAQQGWEVATSYSIYSGTSATGSPIAEVSGSEESFVVTGLDPDADYCFTVQAGWNGHGGPGHTACGSTTGVPPAAPTETTATALTSSRIDVGWAASGAVTGYRVYHFPEGGQASLLQQVAAGTFSYSHLGLATQSTHCYFVRAYNEYGESQPGPTDCETTLANTAIAPGKPALTATGYDESVFTIWSVPSGGTPSSYTLEANTGLLGTYEDVYTGGDSYFSHNGRTNGLQVCYRVTASNVAGSSPVSDVKCATPQAAPISTPVLTATPGESLVDLAWTNSGASVVYTVEADTGVLGAYEAIETTQDREYQHAGLANGEEICYRIQAVRGGAAATSTVKCATPQLQAPSVPEIIQVVQVVAGGVAQKEIVVDWTYDGPTPTGFVIQSDYSGSWTTVVSVAGGVRSHSLTVANFDDRCYRMIAQRSSVTSAPTSAVCVDVVETPPGPTEITQTRVEEGQIVVVWEVPTTGGAVASYDLFRDESLLVSQAGRTYQDTDVVVGQEYCYRVLARNSGGAAPLSPEACQVAGLPAVLAWTNTIYDCLTTLGSNVAWGGWDAEPGAQDQASTHAVRITNSGDLPGEVVVALPSAFTRSGVEIPLAGNVQFSTAQTIEAGVVSCVSFSGPADADARVQVTVPGHSRIWVRYNILQFPSTLPDGTYQGGYTLTEVTP